MTPETQPKLLYVSNFLSESAGTTPFCECLAAKLQDSGFDVRTSSSKARRVPRIVDMCQAVSRFRGDNGIVLIDVFSTSAFVWAEMTSRIAALNRQKVILVLRGGDLHARALRSPSRTKALLTRASNVVTPSRFLQQTFVPWRRDIKHIPNGMDLSMYRFKERAHADQKLIWMRALHQIYRPDVALRALALLKSAYPKLTLELVGPDKGDGTRQELERLAKKLDVSKRLRFVGSVEKSQVPGTLQRGDIFLNTTTVESFGVSVMEAAACGLCIVTSDVGELKFLWEDSEDSILVPAGDPDAVAVAVTRILEEPGLAQKLSTNARHKAEQFDWGTVMPMWEALLNSPADIGNRHARAFS